MRLKAISTVILVGLTCVSCASRTKRIETRQPESVTNDVTASAPKRTFEGASKSVSIPLLVVPQDVPSALFVELTIDDVEHVLVHLDTAAPSTSLGPEQLTALGLAAGEHEIWIGTKKNGFYAGRRSLKALKAAHLGPLHYAGVPAGTVIRGTAGTDLLAGLRVGLDFQNRRLILTPGSETLNGLSTGQSETPIRIPARLIHTANKNEGGVILVKSNFGSSFDGTFLLDTGTNTNLALSSYWKGVQSTDDRTLPFDQEDYRGVKIAGAYRVGHTYILGHRSVGSRTPVWILHNFPALAAESTLFKTPIDGLIGLWGLYQNFVVLDFSKEADSEIELLLFPYPSAPDLFTHSFVGFGFTSRGIHTAVQVEAGSDADKKGLRDGDVLEAVDGGSFHMGSAGVILGQVGETRNFVFNRGGKRLSLKLVAQPLL